MYLLIDSINDEKFVVTIQEALDFDDKLHVKEFFRKFWIFWNDGYVIPTQKMDEFILWFQRHNFEFKFTKKASERFAAHLTHLRTSETTFFRAAKFDDSILRESVKLYNFQRDYLNFALKRNRVFNASDAGLGKCHFFTQKISIQTSVDAGTELDSFILTKYENRRERESISDRQDSEMRNLWKDDRECRESCSQTQDDCSTIQKEIPGSASFDFSTVKRSWWKESYGWKASPRLLGKKIRKERSRSSSVKIEKEAIEKQFRFWKSNVRKTISDGLWKWMERMVFSQRWTKILFQIFARIEFNSNVREIQYSIQNSRSSRLENSLLIRRNRTSLSRRFPDQRKDFNRSETKKSSPFSIRRAENESCSQILQKTQSRIQALKRKKNARYDNQENETNWENSIHQQIRRKIQTTLCIGDLFDFISQKEDHQFIENDFYYQKTPLKIQNEFGYWIDVIAMITKRDRIQTTSFSDGSQMKTSQRHYIFDGEKCVWLSSLKIGSEIRNADGKVLKISNIEISEIEEIVFDLTVVSDTHLYQTADKLVHHNSLESICTFGTWFKEKKIDGIFLIVRPGLSYHWKHEILEMVNLFTEDDIVIITNESKKKAFTHHQDKKILIISNHIVADLLLSYKYEKIPQKKSKMRFKHPFLDIAKEWGKSSLCLVIDESHEFKSWEAVKTRAMKVQLQNFNYRILQSATPAINDFTDWWGQLQMIDRSIIPMSEHAFKLYVAAPDKTAIGDDYSPYKIKKYDEEKVVEIQNRLKLNVIKHLKAEIPEMKAKQMIWAKYFDLTKEQRHLYRYMMDMELKKIEEEGGFISVNDVFGKFAYVVQLIDNPLLLKGKFDDDVINDFLKKWRFEHDSRLEYLDDFLHEYIAKRGKKVVIFDTHPLTLDLLELHYKKYNPLKIHGEIETDNTEVYRREVEQKFNYDPDHKIVLLSLHTSSAGINLYKGSSRIIFFTQTNNSLLFRQGIDRTYRIVSTEDTIVENLVFSESIDYIRFERNKNRSKFNDSFMSKTLSSSEIRKMLLGVL